MVCSSVYGSLVNGRAACEGYSRAAKLLFDEVGIESALVSGISKNEDGTEGPHMWNAVKINGDFYYLDCTWDDPVSEDGRDTKIYTYFNVTTKDLSKTHSEFSYNFVCIDTQENYFVRTGRCFEKYSRSDEKRVRDIIIEDLGRGVSEIQLRFADKKVYKAAKSELFDKGRIHDVLSLVEEKTGMKFKSSVKYQEKEDQYLLTFFPERG